MTRAKPLANLASFGRSRVTLRQFYNRVDKAIYQDDWSDSFAGHLQPGQRELDDLPEGKAQRVRDEVCEALSGKLALGIIVLELSERSEFEQAVDALKSKPEFQESSSTDILFGGRRPRGFNVPGVPDDAWGKSKTELEELLDQAAKQSPNKAHVSLAIAPEFWTSTSSQCVMWSNSTCSIPVEFLFIDKQANSQLAGEKANEKFLFEGGQPDAGSIYIRGSESAIGQIISTPLPSKEWLTRYNRYKTHFVPELIAAAWRHVAFSMVADKGSSSREIPTAEEIITAMQRYIADQGLEPEKFMAPNGPRSAILPITS